MVMEISDILNIKAARQALETEDSRIRYPGSAEPILQLGNSLYGGEWLSVVGTDLIFKREEKQLRFFASSDVRLRTEKATVTDRDEPSEDITCRQ